MLRRGTFCLAMGLCLAAACKKPSGAPDTAGPEGPAASASGAAAPVAQGQNAVAAPTPIDKPRLGITAFVATVYKEPRDTSKKLGYLRVGATIGRSEEPVGKAGCPGGW